jgi:peptide deformylase
MKELFVFVFMFAGLVLSWKGQSYWNPPKKNTKYNPTKNLLENCKFPTTWSMEYESVYTRKDAYVSKPICVDQKDQMKQVQELHLTMRAVARTDNAHDGVCAMNFGVPVRMCYLRGIDQSLVNPIAIKFSTEMKNCSYYEDGVEVWVERHRWLDIAYLDLSYSKHTAHLEKRDSCTMQGLFDSMNMVPLLSV